MDRLQANAKGRTLRLNEPLGLRTYSMGFKGHKMKTCESMKCYVLCKDCALENEHIALVPDPVQCNCLRADQAHDQRDDFVCTRCAEETFSRFGISSPP